MVENLRWNPKSPRQHLWCAHASGIRLIWWRALVLPVFQRWKNLSAIPPRGMFTTTRASFSFSSDEVIKKYKKFIVNIKIFILLAVPKKLDWTFSACQLQGFIQHIFNKKTIYCIFANKFVSNRSYIFSTLKWLSEPLLGGSELKKSMRYIKMEVQLCWYKKKKQKWPYNSQCCKIHCHEDNKITTKTFAVSCWD